MLKCHPMNSQASFRTPSNQAENDTAIDFDELASLYKAAGDSLRLEILRLLANQSYGVLELSAIFGTKQSGMSHHLKVLANAGLVATRREGNSIFYRRALPGNDIAANVREQIFSAADQITLSVEVARRQVQVQSERTEASQAFFTENAAKFRQQQDLIASYPVYAEHISELLKATATVNGKHAIEVGPGEGEFLPLLSQRFNKVTALDNSEQMLEKARTNATASTLDNVTFVLGDTSQLPQYDKASVIVANMVLHHTPAPAEILQHLGNALMPGGALLITDLCHHDQVWAKEACGDIWLGFDPDDLTNWAATAGLVNGQSVFFALRNGFQIQIRQFFKPSLAT